MQAGSAPNFRTLFESAPGLYLVLTPELIIVAVSDAYLRATMTTREAIVGRGLFEVFPDNPDDPAADGVRNLKASLRRVLAGRAPDSMAVQKYDIRRPESEGGGFEERYWSPANSPVLDAAGEIEYIIHRVDDVTELVRLSQRGAEQQKLIEASGLLRNVVGSSDDAIITETLSGLITSWNPGAEKLFGFSAQEVIGQPMRMLIPPENVTEEPQILACMERGESIERFETVRLTKSGRRIDISATISPIRDDHGRIIGVSEIARDITGHKRAQAQVQAQMARLELLNQITRAIGERQDTHSIFQVVVRTLEAELPVDFCCIGLHDPVDNTLTVTSVGLASGALASELALTEQARIPVDQNGLSECLHGNMVYEPDISHESSPFRGRLARRGLRSLAVAPLRVESTVFGVLVTARLQPDGFTRADCDFLRQISEHVALAAHQAQLHGALQKAYDDLRQAQQAITQKERLSALGQMASGIAHDINNAISPVMLYTESLLEREPGLSPEARRYLETIQRAIHDVAQTVARMREFYRPREPQLMLAPVALNAIIQQVMDLTRARWSDLAHQRGIAIEVQTRLAADLPVIMGAESEIREALTNLVFNALDAMPRGGTLTLRTESTPQSVRLEITDTGIGMDEETRRRCLEPFFTTKGERGTGLGLAMVYGVLQRHSAGIDIESAPGRGTTVHLTFATSNAADTGIVRPSPESPRPPALRILLIDDDPVILQSLSDILESDGHTLAAAHGGEAGIEAFRSQEGVQPFDVVITDLGMPHVDGRKVAASVKALAPSVPVILLTGWGQRMLAEGDIPPHVDKLLSKPPRLRQLREALTALTTRSR